jgi:glucoamylase
VKDDGSLFFDETIDVSSMYGMLMFSTAEGRKEKLASTVAKIEKELMQAPSGGATRYNNDYYLRRDQNSQGNPWFVTTLWVAQYYIHTGNQQKAKEIVTWVTKLAMPSGVLSEQIDPNTGGPVGVAPLVWSHAEFVNTMLDITE